MIIKTVSDPSDEVVELDLQVLAAICDNGARWHSPSFTSRHFPLHSFIQFFLNLIEILLYLIYRADYFDKFMMSLVTLFNNDQKLLERRGTFIIEMVGTSRQSLLP